MKVAAAALLLLVSSPFWAAAQNPPDPSKLPEIRVPRAKAALRIDGKLDEADWANAPKVLLRKLDGAAASQRTEARILHDGAHVYIAFQAEDPDIWTAHQGRDSHMWTEDVVEAFIDVDPSEPGYVELEVNPRGDLFDGLFFQHRSKVLMAWNPAIEVAVQVDGTLNQREDKDRSWTVEMSIPVADLAPAAGVMAPAAEIKPGTAWRMEFCRNESSKGKEGDQSELQSWTPVPNDFHATAYYGKVVFE
jgi:Carbohydrate family 9 binding domain-like